eukprot:Rhum_TRINITY_DN21634_c0_g1::Rhum_TRINITY_DN21634_c0_g1_i1::g.174355::m.174355
MQELRRPPGRVHLARVGHHAPVCHDAVHAPRRRRVPRCSEARRRPQRRRHRTVDGRKLQRLAVAHERADLHVVQPPRRAEPADSLRRLCDGHTLAAQHLCVRHHAQQVVDEQPHLPQRAVRPHRRQREPRHRPLLPAVPPHPRRRDEQLQRAAQRHRVLPACDALRLLRVGEGLRRTEGCQTRRPAAAAATAGRLLLPQPCCAHLVVVRRVQHVALLHAQRRQRHVVRLQRDERRLVRLQHDLPRRQRPTRVPLVQARQDRPPQLRAQRAQRLHAVEAHLQVAVHHREAAPHLEEKLVPVAHTLLRQRAPRVDEPAAAAVPGQQAALRVAEEVQRRLRLRVVGCQPLQVAQGGGLEVQVAQPQRRGAVEHDDGRKPVGRRRRRRGDDGAPVAAAAAPQTPADVGGRRGVAGGGRDGARGRGGRGEPAGAPRALRPGTLAVVRRHDSILFFFKCYILFVCAPRESFWFQQPEEATMCPFAGAQKKE